MTEIDIAVEGGAWSDVHQALAFDTLKEALRQIEANGEVSLVLADDEFIRVLNRDYRGKDKATNVLSFPQDEPSLLGDIIVAFETVLREAQEQDKDFEDHFRHLLVHGLLHLLGHDHEEDGEAEEMEALEIQILAKLGIKNPYAADNSVP